MSTWSQVFLQESNSTINQLLSLFHDYSLALIINILVFVTGISISMMSNKLISDSIIPTLVETIWTIIPIFILLALVVPSLQILYFMEESNPYLTIKVMGHQWYWEYNLADLDISFEAFMYKEEELYMDEYRLLQTDSPLVLPMMKNIRVLITASDVLHCWAVPSLGVKADAVPGRLNQVYFNAVRPSIMYGQCSEICGEQHSFMPIEIETISNKKFLEWCSEY
uniref:Cytochrome c oxidase subunit 2 n=1 Tax=Bugula neritina TaxID=10212 RepID=A0A1B0QVQ3_BUGNE|nr:cytochrome c oxidase subunit II [Bugula neritina]